MLDYLSINKIIKWEPDDSNQEAILERVLWLDPSDNVLIVININNSNAMPEIKSLSELETLLSDGCIKILDFYKKENFTLDEELIPDKWKKHRDTAWSLINELVHKEPEIYYSNTRGRLVTEIISKYGSTKPTIYSYLRRYWQGGKTKNCLLPDFFKCGGKGKDKNSNSLKLGRTRKDDISKNASIPTEDSNLPNDSSIIKSGINITTKDRKIFLRAIKDFYKTTVKYPLTATYDKMIFRDYIIGYEIIDGVETPVLLPPDKLPTRGQFRYWTKKDNDIRDIIIAREGEKRYELSHRPVLGKSTHQAFGPGSRYQIDATIASVYLVNSLTRKKIIKKATLYVIIDVFSREITGLYVGLENPSWIGAAMAIANAASDKVAYCKEYDINITPDQWPCMFLPEMLTADRGELEGDGPDNLINSLGVDVEILPPYRADWKAIVESEFRKLDVAAILWLPGAVKRRFRERGEKDYRLGAALTLKEFTKIIINCVLFYNNKHRMNYYDKDEFQIADGVKPIPIELWNWGMANRTGRLKQYSEDIVKLNLMPSTKAIVTPKGIRLGKDLHYSCDTAISENWFLQARGNHTWKIPVSYDPRKIEYIYIRINDGMDYEKCYLLPSSQAFQGKYLEEIEEYDEDERSEKSSNEYNELQEKANLIAQNEHIISTAKKETAKAASGDSDRHRISEIRETSAIEKSNNQKKEAFNLKDKNANPEKGNDASFTYETAEEDDQYIPPQKYI